MTLVSGSRVHQINVAPFGGVPKHPVASAVVLQTGIVGDAQKDLEHHGGPDRAVSLYALELIASLQKAGHSIYPGSTGENLTLVGCDWSRMQSGVRLKIGSVVELEITRPATPCQTIAASFAKGAFKTISHKVAPELTRYYARVLVEGTINTGDEVVFL